MIFMILGIFSIVFCILILVKYVILIHRTNNKVISLFGMIKVVDIRELAQKCDHFAEKFLENKTKEKEKEKELLNSFGGGTPNNSEQAEKAMKPPDGDQSYLQINPNNHTDIQADNKLDISNILDNSQIKNKEISKIPEENSKISKNSSNLQKTEDQKKSAAASYLVPPNKNPGNREVAKKPTVINTQEAANLLIKGGKSADIEDLKSKGEEKKEEIKDNRDEIRQRRLMNTVDNTSRIIILQYSIFVTLFWTYFILDYVFMSIFLSQVKNCYSHLELIAERPSIVKYRIVFTYEEISNAKKQLQLKDIFDNKSGLIDVTEDYRNQMYINENQIFNSLKLDYPEYFNEYKNEFQLLNYGDLCSNLIKTSDPSRFAGKLIFN